ncbi:MAG: MG(2+) CHELATASE FAMILY PROTEIN / ComM-related protein [uncultured Campylobacterales bacterium]|uniref:MG(2+) CHELATASE FAMILY PROTEIN / ComM-related protein n=1 Tax=uncultured Campylobacterales bacterium TaxID=352960 RepID=A0A6S6TG61_9BACT|nr:MAG: MG(2+) CHELATASE FAMILY PROTEIN / ComM-related protein [uncultured Campylobacterales bacterium]
MKKILCACINSNEAIPIDVESSFVRGLPNFSIVGLGGNSIQESKERVKSALSSLEFNFPAQKVTINLSPSDIKKEGSHFDLAIALGVAMQQEDLEFRDDLCILGELGLDGKVKDTNLIFAIVLSLYQKCNITNFLVPNESIHKLKNIPNINLVGVSHIQEAIDLLKNQNSINFETNESLQHSFISVDNKKYYYEENFTLDFEDVISQKRAVRASLIASAGMHNIIYEGSPGCGKSMCAKRLSFIMPPLSIEEILENAKTKALNGDELDFNPIRPIRTPHHTSSRPSIFGGGSTSSKIGEIALANNGVLFFDELPHYAKTILESLREPLEDHTMLISRVQSKIKYDTKILFVGACNPCPCGNLFSIKQICRCNELEIQRYQNKISDALLDRVDLYVKMQDPDMTQKSSMTSKEMQAQVITAFIRQKQRGQKELNAKLQDSEIAKFCVLTQSLENLLNNALEKFGLSLRSKNKILKVARTIADLEDSETIQKTHLLEAMSYKK